MIKLFMIVVFGLSYYLGLNQSDWAYIVFGQSIADDPDRIFGLMTTMGIGAILLAGVMLLGFLSSDSLDTALRSEPEDA